MTEFNPIRMTRLLNTKNIELYYIYSDNVHSKLDFNYYVLIVDLRRKSTMEDFPTADPDDEEYIVRDNLILVTFITKKHFKIFEEFEPIAMIVSDLIEPKESCIQKYEVFEDNNIPDGICMGYGVVEFTNKYLKRLGLDSIDDIELDKFNYLSQD